MGPAPTEPGGASGGAERDPAVASDAATAGWGLYPGGVDVLTAAAGGSPRWCHRPAGGDWARRFAEALVALSTVDAVPS